MWLRPSVSTLQVAGVDMEGGLGGYDAGRKAIIRKISKSEAGADKGLLRMHAHATLGWYVEGLIVPKGHDVSVARHGVSGQGSTTLLCQQSR